MVELTEQQAISKLRMDESRVQQIQQQMQAVARALDETKMTRRTIENLPDKSSEGLLPLGGVFIPVKTSTDNITLNIGAGVAIEKEAEEAIETLKKREESLEKTMAKLQEAGQKISAEAMELRQKLSERAQPDVPVISG